jgi:DNA repair photolyase
MGVIYKPTGLAAEYISAGYALNIHLDCTFGCTYCYNRLHTNRESKPRYNLVARLLSEIDQYTANSGVTEHQFPE